MPPPPLPYIPIFSASSHSDILNLYPDPSPLLSHASLLLSIPHPPHLVPPTHFASSDIDAEDAHQVGDASLPKLPSSANTKWKTLTTFSSPFPSPLVSSSSWVSFFGDMDARENSTDVTSSDPINKSPINVVFLRGRWLGVKDLGCTIKLCYGNGYGDFRWRSMLYGKR